MITALATVVMITAGVALGWGLVTAIASKPPGKAQLIFAAVVEALTLVQSVIALALIAAGFRPAEFAVTIGYLIGIVVLVPLAWFWANNERTRYSGVVLAVAAAGVLVMTVRLIALWVPA